MKRPDRLRKRLFITVFVLFAVLLGISTVAIQILVRANLISLDHMRALGDLRVVLMYLDLKIPGEWGIRSGVLVKGDTPVSENPALTRDLSRYLPPDSAVSLELGDPAEPDKPKSQRLETSDPFLRVIFSAIRLDPRFRRMRSNANGEMKGSDVVSRSSGSTVPESGETAYLAPGGIAVKLFNSQGIAVGWLKIYEKAFERGEIEKWIFLASAALGTVVVIVILAILYVILYRLSAPIVRLEEAHANVIRKNENLTALSRSDPLTGLLNRRGFEESGGSVGVPSGGSNGLAILDLDNFKKINDTRGHACGDFVLVRVAETVRETIRQDDIACRWGGEEFLICFPNVTPLVAYEAADRVRKAIASLSLVYEDAEIPVTVTIGTTTYRKSEEFGDALKRADEAMYRGKSEGKNRVVRLDRPGEEDPSLAHEDAAGGVSTTEKEDRSFPEDSL